MACRKILVWENGLEFLGKALSSRCNCGYKFKCLFIKKIQIDLYMKRC